MDVSDNQPGAPPAADPWAADAVLQAQAKVAGADLAALGRYGDAMWRLGEAARLAERHPPELQRFDRAGRRIDRVLFHPAYHALLGAGLGAGYAAAAWEGLPGGHATHAAMVYLHSAIEPGSCCPMTMTYAAVPALESNAALAAFWRPRLTARGYDPGESPPAAKAALTMGMAMTERQGGSDLRATTTRAEPADGGYRLTGHKWFCSAPMSDGFLTLAQAPGGLTCLVVPRILPDGSLNAVHVMRLKDKLGNRANASAEIEYHGAYAERLGEEGDGIRQILTMVHHTRLDTAIAPAGLMRAALAEARHWAAHRTAFQRRLIDQPLMARVLADLCLDWEGALALGLRIARAFDGQGEADRAFARIGVALAKYLNNKLCPRVVVEAMEVLGGMGYVEDTPLPMLYREAPLNGIWEGSGNVICLDVLRTLERVPLAGEVLRAELAAALGLSGAFDDAFALWQARWRRPAETEARHYAEETALLLSAAALLHSAPPAVAEAFAQTRLGDRRGAFPGATPGIDPGPILARLAPG